eukprot:TRINITY_DN40519_c0_g1_i1.p1 TRINITY_DN40519_c0_g1~~TRINITY_DN40519_c0_g1_i1.p1  ORF type:complete len:561 (+),score=109.25 TRINITY_DN40519_c0_g1_i1:82-1683(+)
MPSASSGVVRFLRDCAELGTVLWCGETGSRAANLHRPGSDSDVIAVVADSSAALGLTPRWECVSRQGRGGGPDCACYEVGHFVQLVLRGNPHLVDTLHARPAATYVCTDAWWLFWTGRRRQLLTEQLLRRLREMAAGQHAAAAGPGGRPVDWHHALRSALAAWSVRARGPNASPALWYPAADRAWLLRVKHGAVASDEIRAAWSWLAAKCGLARPAAAAGAPPELVAQSPTVALLLAAEAAPAGRRPLPAGPCPRLHDQLADFVAEQRCGDWARRRGCPAAPQPAEGPAELLFAPAAVSRPPTPGAAVWASPLRQLLEWPLSSGAPSPPPECAAQPYTAGWEAAELCSLAARGSVGAVGTLLAPRSLAAAWSADWEELRGGLRRSVLWSVDAADAAAAAGRDGGSVLRACLAARGCDWALEDPLEACADYWRHSAPRCPRLRRRSAEAAQAAAAAAAAGLRMRQFHRAVAAARCPASRQPPQCCQRSVSLGRTWRRRRRVRLQLGCLSGRWEAVDRAPCAAGSPAAALRPPPV